MARCTEQEKVLKALQQRLETVASEQQKSVYLAVQCMREEYLEERARLIKVIARLELMKGPHQRSRTGSRETPLTTDEDKFREGLEEMQGRLVQPGQFSSRLESLDKLQYLERKPQEVSWHAFSEEDQRRIVQFLQHQKSAIEIMTADVRKKEGHLEAMLDFYNDKSGELKNE